jgi:hypothetical protein
MNGGALLGSVAVWLLVAAGSAWAQPAPEATALPAPQGTRLEDLARLGVQQVERRILQPIGRVAERRRSRVYVLAHGAPPPQGTRLRAMRPNAYGHEELICTLEVQTTSGGLVECRELERTGRAHATANDIVRADRPPLRVLLAPCLTHVDLAPVIPQVVGELLRVGLLRRPEIVLTDSLDLERRAEAAYWSGMAGDFLRAQTHLELVIFPVLLLGEDKLILNLEYFSVARGRATDVDAVSVQADDMLRSWLRAGRARSNAPPGFRALAAQTFATQLVALEPAVSGGVFALSADSLFVMEFAYPGLRPIAAAALGIAERPQREPFAMMLAASTWRDRLAPAPANGQGTDGGKPPAARSALDDTILVLSEERAPLAYTYSARDRSLRPRASASLREFDAVLQALWTTARAPSRTAPHWWPRPGWSRSVIAAQFGDVDGDARLDALWSDRRGDLVLRRSGAEAPQTFRGFGDIKSLQVGKSDEARAVLWLSDAVWDGEADRLQAVQLVGNKLQVVWRSERFEHTLVGLASADLNGDGAFDVVAAERLGQGTRVHVFLALPGERTAARGGAWTP